METNIEEDIDSKNQHRIKNLPNPISIRDACSGNHFYNGIKNDIDVKLESTNFFKVNYQPAVNEHLTPKIYVDNAMDEISLVRNNQDNDFNNDCSNNINSKTLNNQAVNDIQVKTKAFVDQFHSDNERNGRALGLDFYNGSIYLVKNNQNNDLNDKKLTKIDSITVNWNPTSDNEVASKKICR